MNIYEINCVPDGYRYTFFIDNQRNTGKFRYFKDNLASEIDDEVVMLDADAGQYYGLNSVATAVWKQLDTPAPAGEICDRLVDQ